MRSLWTLWLVVVAIALAGGCSRGPSAVAMASVSPSAAAAAAMAAYDTNHDGKISGEEFAKCPALKAAMDTIDTTKDGAITAEKLTKRMNTWLAAKVGRITVTCSVTLNGTPLEGAAVTLVPEKFLGTGIPSAKGETDKSGMAVLVADGGGNVRGVSFGFYRVEITKQQGGKEAVPAKYNAQTTLGIEVAQDTQSAQMTVPFNLSTR
jgi:hypothetical protein